VFADIPPRAFLASNPHYDQKRLEELGAELDRPLPLVRCNKCGFIFAGLHPSENLLSKIYSDSAREGEHPSLRLSWSAHLAGVNARILAALSSFPDSRDLKILDYGCGHGTLVRQLNAASSRVDAWGFDPDPMARSFMDQQKTPYFRSLAEAKECAPFDMISLNEVLEHVPYPKSLLKEVRTLLRPGGLVWIAVPPMPQSYIRKQLKLFETNQPFSPALNLWEHLNYFSGITLRRMAAELGYEVYPERLTLDLGLHSELKGPALARAVLRALRRLAESSLGGDPMGTSLIFRRI